MPYNLKIIFFNCSPVVTPGSADACPAEAFAKADLAGE
jgi:hypothetical protein